MIKNIPLDQGEQIPVVKGAITTIDLLMRLGPGYLSEAMDSPNFRANVGEPLKALAKARGPRSTATRFSDYLQKISVAGEGDRRKMIESPKFIQLLKQLKKKARWSTGDTQSVTMAHLSLKSQISE